MATGSAFAGTVRIVVPAHDIARGETISEGDLTFTTVDGAALMSGVPTKIEEVKRHAGPPHAASPASRSAPTMCAALIVVTKGQTVTMQFAAPGVELTAMGRAMSEGGIGDTVTIQNPISYRMISATVIAPGTVRATRPDRRARQQNLPAVNR